MFFSTRHAGTLAVVLTFFAALLSSDGSSAATYLSRYANRAVTPATPTFTAQPVVQQVPASSDDEISQDSEPTQSLASLVSEQTQGEALSRELNCLASAIYFESKSESLAGQLAVGRVIIGRAKSGRFPSSYCGVVFQRSQFSFVQGGGSMPGIDHGSRQWRNASAIARIAHSNLYRSDAEGALYFHAARVSPGWGMQRIARIDNHVFYR